LKLARVAKAVKEQSFLLRELRRFGARIAGSSCCVVRYLGQDLKNLLISVPGVTSDFLDLVENILDGRQQIIPDFTEHFVAAIHHFFGDLHHLAHVGPFPHLADSPGQLAGGPAELPSELPHLSIQPLRAGPCLHPGQAGVPIEE